MPELPGLIPQLLRSRVLARGFRALALLGLLGSAGGVPTAMALDIEHGQWQQGALLRGQVAPGTELRFLGHEVPVSADGQFVIGLDRDAPAEVRLIEISPSGQSREHVFAVAPRAYNIQRIDGVERKYIAPSAEELERIRADGRRVRAARAEVRDLPAVFADFHWPLTGPITGVYGSQRVFNGEPRRPHYGVDIAAPTGTLVHAPAGGVVTLAADLFFSGGTLIIDHGHGVTSSFLHLHRMLVAEGDRVAQGDPIAEVGATGRVTGAHLDWRMNWRDQRVDPQTLVPPMAQ